MTIELKYKLSDRVVVRMESWYEIGTIVGYQAVYASYTFTPYVQLNSYEVQVEDGRIWSATENEIADLLARLKDMKAKLPDQTAQVWLWKMHIADLEAQRPKGETDNYITKLETGLDPNLTGKARYDALRLAVEQYRVNRDRAVADL